MPDFRLSGQLEITGINFGPHINNLRRQLSELKIDKSLNTAGVAAEVSLKKAGVAARQTKAEIFAATSNLADFSDKAALALRRFTAFSLAAGATFGSLRLIFGGLKDASNFQRELVKVQQVSGAASKEIAGLRDEISRLGRTFAAPAQELLQVSTTLSQAGYSIREVKKLLETLSLTRLAATFGSLENTTEGVIALTGQFGIKVDNMTEALSILNSVAAKYAVESNDLIGAIKRTGSVFAAARGDVSDTSEALGEFLSLVTSVRQATRLPQETIATGLRQVFARLERPNTLQFFRDLGVQLTDLQGKFVGPYQAIKKIQEAIANLDTRDVRFAQLAEVLGGTRQFGVVIPLLTQARLQDEILNTALANTNSLLKDAKIPLDTINERINTLAASWATLSRNVFESKTFQFLAKEAIDLAGALVRVADSIAPLLPILTVLGGLRLGAAVARSGAIGALTQRLTTGHGKAFASGGYIPGSGSGDKIPILAEPGEFVIKKSAAQKLGASTLHALNNDIPKYAEGGKVGIDFGSDKEFNNIRKEFRNLAKSAGVSNKEFNTLANEVRLLARNTAEARKLFAGGVQARTHAGGGIAGLINAPELANYEQLDTITRIQAAKRQKILQQRPFNVYNQSRRYVSPEERLARLPEAPSLEFLSAVTPSNQKLLTHSNTIFAPDESSPVPPYVRPTEYGGLGPKFYKEIRRRFRQAEKVYDVNVMPGPRTDYQSMFVRNRSRAKTFPGLLETMEEDMRGITGNPDARLLSLEERKARANTIVESLRRKSRAPIDKLPVLVRDSLENLTNPAHQMAVGLGGFRTLDSNVPKTLTNADLGYALRDRAFVGGGLTFGGATYGQASKRTLAYGAKNKLKLGGFGEGGKDFQTSLLPGESVYGDLQSLRENGLSAAKEYLSGVGGRLKERFDPVKTRLARTGRHLFRRTQIAGIRSARSVGNSINNADPLTLAALAAGVEYGGNQLGFEQTTTAPISGALGGASAGKAFLGGKYGAAIGAAFGGATAFSQSQRTARLEQPTKDLEKNTDDLSKAFEDLKNGIGGAAERVDQLLSKQNELQAQLNTASKSTIGDKLKTVGVGAASLLPFLPKSLLQRAGTGIAGLGSRATGIIAGNPGTAAGAAAAAGLIYGGRAAYRASFGYGDENLGFFKNLRLGAPQKGQTIGGDLAYKLFEQDAGITTDIKQKSLGNVDSAKQAREGIAALVKSGKGANVSDALILSALSDNAAIQQGFSNAGGVGSTEQIKQANLASAQRNQINLYRQKSIDPSIAAQKKAEELAKALDFSIKSADLFANKLDHAANLLDVFGANLEQSKTEIDNTFNVANGNFDVNRTFSNPFDNIKGLNRGQIANQIGGIESFLGTNLNNNLKGNLLSVPTLERLPEIINNELASAKSHGYDTSNIGGFITGLTNKKTGELGTLPDVIKKNIVGTLGNLDNEQATAFLSGNTNNRHTNAIRESLNQGKDQSVDFAKKLQDQINNFLKLQDAAGNQRASLLTSQTRLGANYADTQAAFIDTRHRLRNEPTNPLVSRELQRNSIRQLTGLQDPTAQNIGQNINRLMEERNKILADSNIGESERISRLSSVNSQLTTNKEALEKLATSSLGLADIQQKLTEIEGRKADLSGSVIDEALGGNTLNNKKADLAFQLFQEKGQQGQNGLLSVVGSGLSKEDLRRGIEREKRSIGIEQGAEAAQKFENSTAEILNKQGAGFTIDPERAKRNAAAFQNLNGQQQQLVAAGDKAGADQLDAIQEQRKLLGENIAKFDEVVTSKFVAGVSQLSEIAKSLNIPESVSIQATHVHQFQFTGLDLESLNPYFKQIAEEAINKALSHTTDGAVKQGAPTPSVTNARFGKKK